MEQKLIRPRVTINLEPYLQDFLWHEFGCSKNEEGVIITSAHDIGEMILSQVVALDRPPKLQNMENPITLLLPTLEWNHYLFRDNFICIPELRQKQVQKYIKAYYHLRIKEYFVAGYAKGYKQDVIIRSFLEHYNIKNNATSYDAVKKYDYRSRQKIIKEVNRDIQKILQI